MVDALTNGLLGERPWAECAADFIYLKRVGLEKTAGTRKDVSIAAGATGAGAALGAGLQHRSWRGVRQKSKDLVGTTRQSAKLVQEAKGRLKQLGRAPLPSEARVFQRQERSLADAHKLLKSVKGKYRVAVGRSAVLGGAVGLGGYSAYRLLAGEKTAGVKAKVLKGAAIFGVGTAAGHQVARQQNKADWGETGAEMRWGREKTAAGMLPIMGALGGAVLAGGMQARASRMLPSGLTMEEINADARVRKLQGIGGTGYGAGVKRILAEQDLKLARLNKENRGPSIGLNALVGGAVGAGTLGTLGALASRAIRRR